MLMGKVEADKMMALQQRDEAAGRCASLMQELDRVGVTNQHMKCLQRHDDLENIPVQQVTAIYSFIQWVANGIADKRCFRLNR